MSDSVRCHRQQPTRLPRAWDSPGHNTGVGCHFLLQCMKVKSESEVTQLCLTCRDLMDYRLLRPWDFPSKSTGVGCHCLLHCSYLNLQCRSTVIEMKKKKIFARSCKEKAVYRTAYVIRTQCIFHLTPEAFGTDDCSLFHEPFLVS